MSAAQRQQKFEEAVQALPDILPEPRVRIAKNFGFSNSARIIEGGLFACTNNLEAYSRNIANAPGGNFEQFVFLCVLTFPPQDEVYFSIVVQQESSRVDNGLIKLHHEGLVRNAEAIKNGVKPGKINNNVKFYITDSGQIYFHNYDFRESLRPGVGDVPLDPDCMGQIDAIHFAIWPPAASARRSLLAREFVGYLGNLIGRERVHELQAWEDDHAAIPTMRRMPSSLAIEDIEAAVQALGGHYPGGEVRHLHAALNFLAHKHFVILSGLSGTGKTQLAIQYARAVHGLSMGAADPFLIVCPVRPEWTDPAGLTGYYDVLSNRYVVPPFLEAVLLATAHPQSPVFVILDELNLARVEYYLSDVLSCIETREVLRLHSSGVPLEGSTGTSIPAELPLPSNLFLIGTINVDETTNPVSDKVLDRAMVIDMSSVDLDGFLNVRLKAVPSLSAAVDACSAKLIEVHGLMATHGMGFGYRVAEEFIRYHSFVANKMPAAMAGVFDDLLVQKVLIKLRGSERHRTMLNGLRGVVAQLPKAVRFIDRLLMDLDEYGSFQASK